jgi:hypothetical protein
MNTFLNKKYVYIAVLFFTIPACAFAINILAEGYQVASTVTKIDAYGICKNVNATDGKTYFIPTKSQAEWQSVVDHKPEGVVLGACTVKKCWSGDLNGGPGYGGQLDCSYYPNGGATGTECGSDGSNPWCYSPNRDRYGNRYQRSCVSIYCTP